MTTNNETKEAIITGLKLGLAILVLLLFAMPYLATEKSQPTVMVDGIALTPEQFAEKKNAEDKAKDDEIKRKDEEIKRHEKLVMEEYETRGIAGLKVSEMLLEGAEKDLKNGNISRDMDVYFIGAVLGVIYGTAQSIQDSWDKYDSMSQADKNYLKSMESRLSSFQQKVFPKMRLAFTKRTKETLWINDVTAHASGTGSTVLTMYGYHFAANANIKLVQEQLNDLVTKLRFKQIQFSTSQYDGITYYKLSPPSDNTIATYNDNGEFKKLDRKMK